jgi:hypothetical protein
MAAAAAAAAAHVAAAAPTPHLEQELPMLLRLQVHERKPPWTDQQMRQEMHCGKRLGQSPMLRSASVFGSKTSQPAAAAAESHQR